MNRKECMIVDLDKRGSQAMFVTDRIAAIKKNSRGLWSVQFNSSPRWFHYNPSRLLYLSQPEQIDLKGKGLYVHNRHITDVAGLIRFADDTHTFYHITYLNGLCEDAEEKDVYVTRTPIDQNGGSIWQYLNKLADETGLLTDDKESILSKQYEKVDVNRDNVPLAQFLGNKDKLAVYPKPKHIVYPFSCNASQKVAVEAALTHQVSIIQGPPGTGKTQTILNIIANLLMQDKSVLVVSNNNSAVENVAEKLSKQDLGVIVAQLGSRQNRKSFIENQPPYPDMTEWKLADRNAAMERMEKVLEKVSKGFESQLRQAQLHAEYDALLLEWKHAENVLQQHPTEEWIHQLRKGSLMKLLHSYRMKVEKNRPPHFWFRLQWAFRGGWRLFSFLNKQSQEVIDTLEKAFYQTNRDALEHELKAVEALLEDTDQQEYLSELQQVSMELLKEKIASRYHKRQEKERTCFKEGEISRNSKAFLAEYPVVLSTTYSAKSCISPHDVFDYVIMDEASQVDIKTGALALSCAKNAVIVGDDKQLPNVIGREEALALQAIQETYQIDDKYNAVTHSFLESCLAVFTDIPVTLLREHYRCHPKIIEFCNRKFYNKELVAMTDDKDEERVLQVIYTGKGNYARGHFNQREIDVIAQEVMPLFTETDSVGIITPYRLQAEEINKVLGKEIASTVHKFQGRECDAIVLSMVDNKPTEFSDNANLLNVAISRAKTSLYVVTNENEKSPQSILGQLIAYMKYNNCEETKSKLHSVFDLLYKAYTEERLAFEKKYPSVSEHVSENLVYAVLKETFCELLLDNVDVLCHYPLSRLIADWSVLDETEKSFAESPYAHVDFLVYNALTKQPLLTIEVDGWHFHQESEVQQSRDALKDRLLAKFGLCPIRISTTDTLNVETCKALVNNNLNHQS